MPPIEETQRSVLARYEAVFCIFLAAIAFLGKGSSALAFPELPQLLILLLSLNLAAGFALRRWPSRRGVSAAVILANCAVVSAILQHTGGRESVFWVLYLLPVFTASIYLSAKETAWIAAGAVGFNLAFFAPATARWDLGTVLDLAVRGGILVLAAVLTWRLAEGERRALDRVGAQRREMGELLERSRRLDQQDADTRRLAEVGLVTAGVLHDLKTPLTVILGSCDIGLAGADPASMRGDFERIRRAGRVCRDILEQVLEAAGPARRAQEPCDLGEVLAAVLSMCEPVLARKRIALSRPPEEPLPVRGTFAQLQRLFLNLVTNAIQAMPQGGALTVEARRLEPPAPGMAPRVQVIVADDGPGLPPEALAALFKPFSTTRAGKGGTGLGLYLCRQIALNHRGNLLAENPPEGGARFTLTLPMADTLPRPAGFPTIPSHAGEGADHR